MALLRFINRIHNNERLPRSARANSSKQVGSILLRVLSQGSGRTIRNLRIRPHVGESKMWHGIDRMIHTVTHVSTACSSPRVMRSMTAS